MTVPKNSALLLMFGLILNLPVAPPLLAVPWPAPAQQKPFSQDQVQAMVRDGFGDESDAKQVAPTLRSAPADLKVSATTAEPASAKKPINQVQAGWRIRAAFQA